MLLALLTCSFVREWCSFSVIQSYGNFTCEEITYDESGKLVQDSFGKYKIPTSSMTPRRYVFQMSVALFFIDY